MTHSPSMTHFQCTVCKRKGGIIATRFSGGMRCTTVPGGLTGCKGLLEIRQ